VTARRSNGGCASPALARRAPALAALLVVALAALAGCAEDSTGPARPSTGSPKASPPPVAAKPPVKEPAPEPGPKNGVKPAGDSPAAPAAPTTGLDALPPRAQRLFAEAIQAREELEKQKLPMDWALLERRWRAVLEAADLAEAHFNLGVALEGQGRADEARAEYERARVLKPGLRQAAVNLGVLLEKAGDLRGAAATYAAVARDFPEDARARERLAVLYLGGGQLDEAWRLAREALQRDPRSVTANVVMIRVAAQRNQVDLAKLIALRTARLAPADPVLPFLTGELAARENDEPGAELQWKKALALDPRYLPARSALLRAAVRRGKWGAAAEHAEAFLKERPNDPVVQLALGVALRHAEKPDDALAAYARAEELSGGKLAEVYLARGALLMQVKQECEPALEEFRKYAQAAGPVAATESPVLKLQRECEVQLEENRKALEAAKAMKAKQKPAAAPEGKPKEGAVEGAKDGGDAPTPAPVEVP
jgi:tetratricopeptide (TPR) repeat protein